jgi:protein involved in polysaccharide export with SLBB domain
MKKGDAERVFLWLKANQKVAPLRAFGATVAMTFLKIELCHQAEAATSRLKPGAPLTMTIYAVHEFVSSQKATLSVAFTLKL